MKKLNLAIVWMLFCASSFAQMPNLKLPTDPEKADEAKRRFAISVDEMSVKSYEGAINAIQWLEKNAPQLYDGLYINGYKAYEEMAKKEQNKAQKEVYLDSMMYFYDKKEERFELTDREKNNRAYRYYKYWKSNKSKIGKGMDAYAIAYENIGEVINNNLVSYMDMSRRFRAYGNEFSNEEVLEVYTKVMAAIEAKELNGGDTEKLERYRPVVNGLLTQIIGDDLNCEFINNNLAPPLDHEEDIKLAKKVFGLLLGQGCADSPYYIKSALMIQKVEPTTGLAKAIAQKYYKEGDLANASSFYMEAVNMEEDYDKKADLYLDLAKLNLSSKNKNQARMYALEAAKLDGETKKEAYSFIGDLYMNSFNDCKKNVSQIDDRAVFMAAYDMYYKAADYDGMNNAKAQFPTVSDVFTANKQEGDPIQVGCWINVSTKIKTRPSE